jgi:apolipoprotein N-acyltransferase
MKKLSQDFFICLMAGGLYALSYPSFLGHGFLPLVFVALSLFLWKLESYHFKPGILIVLGFNLGLNFIGYYWIPHTMREFGELPYFISMILGSLASLILQPHWWVYLVWKKFRPHWDWSKEKNVLLSAFVMTILERFIPQLFPSYVGSPWLYLAPYLGLAPYFGTVAFSFMTYWLCLETLVQLRNKKPRVQVWTVMGLFFLFNITFPLSLPSTGRQIPVRVVQANIGNFLKVNSESGDQNSFDTIAETYQSLSMKENGFRPQLIIWPETAYPHTFYGFESMLSEKFLNIMNQSGSEMLIGGYDQDMTKSSVDFIESVFNSSLLLSEGKVKSIYHKNILIPFGETLPFGPLNKAVVSVVPAISLFAKGSGIPVMETKTGYRFVTPICYEILDSNYMRDLLNQWGNNHFIVNHTNDSWYGNTAEPWQHLFLSKWRALEFQLPIIRSTNTGISSVIYQDGSESRQLGVNETGVLDVNLPVMTRPKSTLYQDYGVLPFLICFGIIYLLTWWREKTGIRP